MEIKTDFAEFEVNRKFEILSNLSLQLLKAKGAMNKHVLIHFDHDYGHLHKPLITTSIGHFKYFWHNDTLGSAKESVVQGIRINIESFDFSIGEILHLLNASISNEAYIRQSQRDTIIDLHSTVNGVSQYDTLLSIPTSLIAKYRTTKDPVVDNLLNHKSYPGRSSINQFEGFDYFFQNNSFHFYHRITPTLRANNGTRDDSISVHFGIDSLTVSSVFEVFGSKEDGHFVFINDSIFYFIPNRMNSVKGPFNIGNSENLRGPIRKYFHEFFPIEQFTFVIDNFYQKSKVAFFPDSNKVISNFEHHKKHFIKNLFNANESSTKSSFIEKHWLLILLFSISVIVNLFFLSKLLINKN